MAALEPEATLALVPHELPNPEHGDGGLRTVRTAAPGVGHGPAGTVSAYPRSMARDRTPSRVEPLRDRPGERAESLPDAGTIEVRRSGRRRRTVSAYRDGARTIVLIPARFTRAEERHWVETMLGRLAAGDQRRRPSDDALLRRCTELSERYLGGAATPSSVRWAGNQRSRWGSCTPADASIRVSTRLRGMPAYVLDYVLLHELAHLLRPAHDREFWRLLASYPRLERARGYLEGYAAARAREAGDDAGDPEGADLPRDDPSDDPEHDQEHDPEPGSEPVDHGAGESARTTLF